MASSAIDKYFLLLFEYLHIMQTSSYVESAVSPNIVQIGWNAVTHVYKVSFANLKNVEDAFQKAQKGMYCFLEYIEQISKQTVLAIEPLEAVIFVYDKVLSPIGESHPVRNSPDVPDTSVTLKTIEKLGHLANLLVCFDFQEWTLAERIRVAEDMFYKFANLFLSDASMEFDALFQYIEMVKSAITQPIGREEWVSFMNSVYKYTKRAIKQKTVPTEAQVSEKCLALKPEIRERGLSAANMDDIAKLVFA
jgi:hypothetical protein